MEWVVAWEIMQAMGRAEAWEKDWATEIMHKSGQLEENFLWLIK
jgi:hypothetical protein